MAFLSGPQLLDWTSSPRHLQFNKFVLTGYRPVSSGSECVRSLFYLHNELGNIYTHGIPLLGFLFLLPANIPWSQIAVSWLGVVHYLACIMPHLGSVLYHLFMNHEGGESVYHTLLTLDMCGVCMVNTLEQNKSVVLEIFPRFLLPVISFITVLLDCFLYKLREQKHLPGKEEGLNSFLIDSFLQATSWLGYKTLVFRIIRHIYKKEDY